jgi:hypothetical protein
MHSQAAALTAVLEQSVFARGAHRPFAELTGEDVRSRAGELRAAVGWGPTARVAPVARAWRQLGEAMAEHQAATVAGLPGELVLELAPRLGVLAPGPPRSPTTPAPPS